MDATRKVLLTDGLVGGFALLFGFWLSAPLRLWSLPLAGVTALGMTGLLYSQERDLLAGRAYVLALAFAGLPLLLAVLFALARPALGKSLALAVFLGVGGGILGHRFVFGVVRDVPESRLARAR
jgi:hypothetical protein